MLQLLVCVYVGMSFLTILCIHDMCVSECWDSCLHGALWRQGAEGRVSCDLDNRWHPLPGVPLCKPETLSIDTPICVCVIGPKIHLAFLQMSHLKRKKVVIFKWRVTGNSGNIQQTLMMCNKWFSQPGIEPGTNCSGLFYNLNDICILDKCWHTVFMKHWTECAFF